MPAEKASDKSKPEESGEAASGKSESAARWFEFVLHSKNQSP